MKAILKNYHQSPRKVRLITTLITGKSVSEARSELDALIKRGSLPIKKVLDSAVANATHNGKKSEAGLFVKSARVDKGLVARRHMPRMGGRSAPIKKRSSTIIVELGEK